MRLKPLYLFISLLFFLIILIAGTILNFEIVKILVVLISFISVTYLIHLNANDCICIGTNSKEEIK